MELYRRPFALSDYHRHVARWIPHLLKGRTNHASDDPEAFRKIAFSTFLIWGTADEITPLPQGQRLNSLVPGSKLMLLPGGHVPMIEEPEKFAVLLEQALGRASLEPAR